MVADKIPTDEDRKVLGRIRQDDQRVQEVISPRDEVEETKDVLPWRDLWACYTWKQELGPPAPWRLLHSLA